MKNLKTNLNLSEFKKLAKTKGGKCLSSVYVNYSTKLRFRCEKGHEWEALPGNVKSGHWCLICGNYQQGRKKALSISEMKQIALKRDGLCLSDEYKDNRTNLKWKCSKGHEWEAVASSIKMGSWCPICAGKLPPDMAIESLKKLALEKGGRCLSNEYIDAKTKLRWRCAKNHEWYAIPDSIRRGTWCSICANNSPISAEIAQARLAELQELARERGGRCLSEIYTGTDTKMKWRCAEGHEWEAKADHIKDGHWCPNCSTGIMERVCRTLLEKMTDKKFPKVRPGWLIGGSGRKMELDGYSEKLSLAFEYQGEQHFKYIAHFHRERNTLKKRLSDDKLKRRLCKKNGVMLLEIPYTIDLAKISNYLFIALKKLKIKNLKPVKFDSVSFDSLGVRNPKYLDEMRRIAEARGGKCLSRVYLNNNTKMKWKCSAGHEWEAVPSSIKVGSWCPICLGKVSPDVALESLKKLALVKGGHCLSAKYINSSTKLRWRCKEGHEWNAAPNNIRSHSWCPICSNKIRGPKRLGLKQMMEVAKSRGGVCIATEYINSDTKMKWRCSKGHEWMTTPGSIVHFNTWCPICAGRLPADLAIESLKKMAIEKGGECLSDKYVNGNTKLKWLCKEGHEWDSAPVNI